MEHVVTEFDLWGPFTGPNYHPHRRRAYLKHRAWVKPIFLLGCIIAVCVGLALALAGYSGPQL
jgi:hypothetical protein